MSLLRRAATAGAAVLFIGVLEASASPAPLSKSAERTRFHPDARPMPATERLAGFERRSAAERSSLLPGLGVRNVGPEAQGGRIVDIAAPANRPETLLLAFASGGLWRTENRGGSWTPLFDFESSMTLGAVALGDGEGKVIWAGTGEANSSRTSYAGTGVFRSNDFGRTWTNAGLRDSHHVARIVVDRSDPERVFVAAMGPLYTVGGERGLYLTTDGGRTWKRVLFVDERTGAVDVVQDPADPKVFFAATWERDRKAWNFLEAGPGSGIWKSVDGGESWKRLEGGFPQGETVGRIGLAVTPARPGTLYALLDNHGMRPASEPPDDRTPPGELSVRRLKGIAKEAFLAIDAPVLQRFLGANGFPKDLKADDLKKQVREGTLTVADLVAWVSDADRDMTEQNIVGLELYRSDDAGGAFRRTHEGRLEDVTFTYGYYFGRVAVAPDDAERVYVGGVPVVGSKDGGKSWKGLDRLGTHADHHAFHFDSRNPRAVALGNDGGLNLSFDGGETWTKVNNLPVGQFTSVAVDDAEPYRILGGLQDNGTMRGPSDYLFGVSDPRSWTSIGGGDGSCVQVDPKDAETVYVAAQFGAVSRRNLKSGDRTSIRPRPALKEKPLRFNWVTPFLLSPHSRNILWLGANRLFRSFDRGDTWTPVSPDLTSNREQGDVPFGTITTVAESPKKFGVLWAGTDEGKVWGSRDGGVTWADLSKGLASGRWVTRVVASSFDEGTVYATQSGYREDDFAPYVWKSTDYGKSWVSLARGLPAEPVNVIREDPKAEHVLWIGTDIGAWVSLDRGATWTPVTGGLPHVAVHDIAVQAREGDAVLGTHGRSIFVVEAAPLRELTDEARKKPLFLATPKKASWKRGRGYEGAAWWAHLRKPETVALSWWAGSDLAARAGGKAKLTVADQAGNVWKEATVSLGAGLNGLAYDLSADREKADAAEADAKRRREDKADKAEKADKADRAEKTEGTDQDTKVSREAREALEKALADPLRDRRPRYLAAGKYTVTVEAGGEKANATLEVKAPKKEEVEEDDDGA